MVIVSQSTSLSYSASPSLLMLCAPRIAGLLPARIPERPAPSAQTPIFRTGLTPGGELLPKKSWRDLPRLPSIEEMDAEIDAYVQASRAEFMAVVEARRARYAAARKIANEVKA